MTTGIKNEIFTADAVRTANIGNAASHIQMSAAGEVTMTSQPAFLARPNGNKNNVTGNGTNYTIVFDDEVFDQNADFDGTSTFTAPITGKYRFSAGVALQEMGSANNMKLTLVTSNHTYMFFFGNPPTQAGGYLALCGSILVDMNAAHTAHVVVTVEGVGADTADVLDNSDGGTYFCGELVC